MLESLLSNNGIPDETWRDGHKKLATCLIIGSDQQQCWLAEQKIAKHFMLENEEMLEY